MKHKLAIFDIEVLLNIFVCCVLDISTRELITFEISKRKNDMDALVQYFTANKHVFVGYNNIHYDSPIVCYIIRHHKSLMKKDPEEVTKLLQNISNEIIVEKTMKYNVYKYSKSYHQIDLLAMMFSTDLRLSLKDMQVTMLYKNVKEMEIDWRLPLHETRFDELITYCKNDIDSTKVLLQLNKHELQLRKDIEKEMQIDCLSKDGVNLGVSILEKFYTESTGLTKREIINSITHRDEVIQVKDIILPIVKFKTEKFNYVLELFKQAKINDGSKSFKHKMVNAGVKYSIALGGIHSINNPELIVPKSDEKLIDIDVASLYPSAIINFGFYPRHLGKKFIEIYTKIRTDRLIAKRGGNKLRDAILKLALNGAYGNFNQQYSWLFDPRATFSITVNNQLLIMMLCEEFILAKHKIVSINTDGVTLLIKNAEYDNFKGICNAWEKYTNFELEEVRYEKMAMHSVGAYIAYKEGYEANKDKFYHQSPEVSIYDTRNDILNLKNKYIKEKGFLITEPRMGKGLDCLIISKAVQDYFGRGVPIEETIRASKSIWDFVRYEKVGKDFTVMYNEEKQQHTNRYYVSNKGAYLYKSKLSIVDNKRTGQIEKTYVNQHMFKGYGVCLFNEYQEKKMENYDINYTYYIAKARDIVNDICPVQTTLF